MTIQPHAAQVPVWTVGDRIRKAREINGWTQEELATASGLSRGTISTYEVGTAVSGRPVRYKRYALDAIAKAAEVDPDWLAGQGSGGGESFSSVNAIELMQYLLPLEGEWEPENLDDLEEAA